MKRITVALIIALVLLLAPSVASAATGIEVVSRTGDGVWTDDTWQVQIFPGETKATTLSLYNSSSSSLDVAVTVSPSSLDNGNLTFELDKPSFTMPGKSYADVTLSVRASGSATPGTYTTELEIKSELPRLRGDANDDGIVDIFDAMFIAQYLVGLRGPEELNLYNAASVKHDDPEDIIDIFDAMFIAQYVVGLRDANFEWID